MSLAFIPNNRSGGSWGTCGGGGGGGPLGHSGHPSQMCKRLVFWFFYVMKLSKSNNIKLQKKE